VTGKNRRASKEVAARGAGGRGRVCSITAPGVNGIADRGRRPRAVRAAESGVGHGWITAVNTQVGRKPSNRTGGAIEGRNRDCLAGRRGQIARVGHARDPPQRERVHLAYDRAAISFPDRDSLARGLGLPYGRQPDDPRPRLRLSPTMRKDKNLFDGAGLAQLFAQAGGFGGAVSSSKSSRAMGR